MTNHDTGVSAVGFTTLLGLLFIALKLTGQIGWSWWWVLAPIWLPPAIVLVCHTGSWALGWLFCSREERYMIRLADNLRRLGRSQ